MESWAEILNREFKEDYFQPITLVIRQEMANGRIFPSREDIFRAFEVCPLATTKVVILGMDPYPTAGQGHGLAFSVRPGVKVPASLKNIYKELQSDLDIMPANHGSLLNWAKQGVLLLNTALTVREGEPGSHIKIWELFTRRIIKHLNEHTSPLVFLLWGNHARKKKCLITNPQHLVLESAHPSPLACARFFGCKHFSQVNQFLTSRNIMPINWKLPEN